MCSDQLFISMALILFFRTVKNNSILNYDQISWTINLFFFYYYYLDQLVISMDVIVFRLIESVELRLDQLVISVDLIIFKLEENSEGYSNLFNMWIISFSQLAIPMDRIISRLEKKKKKMVALCSNQLMHMFHF